jgi:hypothetical protein
MHAKQLQEQMSTIPTAIAMASAFHPTFFLHRADWHFVFSKLHSRQTKKRYEKLDECP